MRMNIIKTVTQWVTDSHNAQIYNFNPDFSSQKPLQSKKNVDFFTSEPISKAAAFKNQQSIAFTNCNTLSTSLNQTKSNGEVQALKDHQSACFCDVVVLTSANSTGLSLNQPTAYKFYVCFVATLQWPN